MPRASLSESLRKIGEKTAGGVRKGRVFQVFGGGAIVDDGSIAHTTTDEPIRAGDPVWEQPTQKRGGGVVIHGRA